MYYFKTLWNNDNTKKFKQHFDKTGFDWLSHARKATIAAF
jgi:hypothetical protein